MSLRELRPKPPTVLKKKKTTSTPTTEVTEPRQIARLRKGGRDCKVALCQNARCNLPTHTRYGQQRAPTQLTISQLRSVTIAPNKLTGVEFDLFRYFMDIVLPECFLLRGVGVPNLASQRDVMQTFSHSCQASKVVVWAVLGESFCEMFLYQPLPRPPSHDRNCREVSGIYRKASDALRDPTDLDDLLILTIMLSTLDFCRGEDLELHRTFLREVAGDRVHTLTKSLPYILEGDRRLAIWTRGFPVLHTLTYSKITGYEFLQEVKELIELCERGQVRIHTGRHQKGSPYFYYRRECLSTAFVHLHAEAKDREWCVAVAARVIEYPITFHGEVGACMPMMMRHLTAILKNGVHETDWLGYEATLIWILFVIEDIEGLHHALPPAYGSLFPGQWAEQQLRTMEHDFVLPPSLRPRFEALCREIDRTARPPVGHQTEEMSID